MNYIQKYKSMGILSENAAFEYLTSNLKDTIRTYDFFVAWEKVIGNVSKIEVSLNIMNSLIGKSNIETALKNIIKDYPEIVLVIPLLIAVRGNTIIVLALHAVPLYQIYISLITLNLRYGTICLSSALSSRETLSYLQLYEHLHCLFLFYAD